MMNKVFRIFLVIGLMPLHGLVLASEVAEFFQLDEKQRQTFSSETIVQNKEAYQLLRLEILKQAKAEAIRQGAKQELSQNYVSFQYPESLGEGRFNMPYHRCETKGEMPKAGWPLFIDLHGSGPLEGEYKAHKNRYQFYKGKFIVPRGDHYRKIGFWSMGHFAAIENLINQMILFENVDPNRVYLMGFSEGANGIFRVISFGRLLDRFAGLAPSSGAGDKPRPLGNLLNTAFFYQWGNKDYGYDRHRMAKKITENLETFKKKHPSRFHFKSIEHDAGHHIPDYLEQYSSSLWLSQFKRSPYPDQLIWRPHPYQKNFYWLSLEDAKKSKKISASYENNRITLNSESIDSITIYLNDEMIDYNKEVTVKFNDEIVFQGKVQRSLQTMLHSWNTRKDVAFIFPTKITVKSRM